MKEVLYLGLNGFPKGSAEVEKQKLILRIFILNNYSATILCKRNFYTNNYPYKGEIEGIKYFYTTYSFIKKNRIENRIRQFFGQFIEKIIIFKHIPDIAIISSRSFVEILSYYLLFRFTKTKILLTHVEDIDSINKKGFINQINNKLFNKYAFRLVDGGLPISDFLSAKIIQNAPQCPFLKLPVLVDYEVFQTITPTNEFKKLITFDYFLFCGSTAYIEIIRFIKLSYEKANSKYKLVLLINGQNHEIELLKKELESDKIIVFSGIEFCNLIYLYNNAKALLIPLRETTQDKARFPHKIGEYCATGNLIITNDWGEIPNYFSHLKNAYICNHYSVDDYAEALSFVEQNSEIAENIGVASKLMAQNTFNYKVYAKPLLNFIESIKK